MFMHCIKLKNILSFGPGAEELEPKPLNVLIGPNGSGKSNLIEVIGLLRAAPRNLTTPHRSGRSLVNATCQLLGLLFETAPATETELRLI